MEPKMPPGPNGLPIIGCFANLKPLFCIALERYGKEYGSIFTIKLGQKHVVILNSSETVKEAFVNQADKFKGRPKEEFDDATKRNFGIIFEDGDAWASRKKMILSLLKDSSFAKTGITKTIQDETADLIKFFHSKKGYPFTYEERFRDYAGNVINGIVANERPAEYDKKFKAVINALANIFRNTWAEYVAFFFPCLVHLPFFGTIADCISNRSKDVATFAAYYSEKLSTFRTNFDINKDPQNFMEGMLKVEANYAAENTDYNKEIYDRLICGITLDFYIGGFDPTALGLDWMFVLLAVNPTSQDKLAQEIIATFGKDGPIDYEKKSQMPYTRAVLDECMRFSSVVPLAVPHKTTEDAKVMEYDIPKDTIVMANTYSIHHNPNYWEKPHSFYPEHFLSQDGKEYRPNENLLHYSTGPRLCLGYWIADWEMFITTTAVIREFRVELNGKLSKKEVTQLLVGCDGGSRRLAAHQLAFKSRN